MTLTITGSVGFTTALQPFVNSANAKLGDRIGNAVILAKPAKDMPRRSDGGPSYGFWRSKLREVWLWDEIEEYPVIKTAAHEVMHILDDDWLTVAQRRDILGLIVPVANGWSDQRIDGKKHPYVALPSEAFAVYGSSAIFGYRRPAYEDLFLRRVPKAMWPKLAEMALKDYGHAQPEPEPPEPTPLPPDPAQAELDRLNALLAEISQDNTELAAMQLTVANKGKAEVPQ